MIELGRRIRFLYVLVFLISFSANSLIAIQWPRTGGDWDSYGTVAQNIYTGNGVSLSPDPPYKPAFGGNSFPGYPAFIALVWFIFGQSLTAVRIAQGALLAASIVFFSWVLQRIFKDKSLGIFFGFFMALSPLSMAWSRHLQVEAISMASIILFFSFLLLTLAERKIYLWGLSLSLLFAQYIRTDGFLLFIPLCSVVMIRDLPFRKKLFYGLIISAIFIIGTGVWLFRNWIVGLKPITPPPMLVMNQKQDIFKPPYGYLLWGSTWISKEYERSGWSFPVTRTVYDSIYIAPAAFDNEAEKREVNNLITRLKAYKGKEFPEKIDDEFRRIAIEKIINHPFRFFFTLPAKRMFALWYHPGGSAGWPLQMDDLSYEERTRLESHRLSGILALLKSHPIIILGKAGIFLNTLFIYFAGLAGCILILRSEHKLMGIAIAGYCLIRTLFYAYTNNVESRYMSQLIPLLYFLTVYSVYFFGRQRKEFGK